MYDVMMRSDDTDTAFLGSGRGWWSGGATQSVYSIINFNDFHRVKVSSGQGERTSTEISYISYSAPQ